METGGVAWPDVEVLVPLSLVFIPHHFWYILFRHRVPKQPVFREFNL
jgi:hypothetical protein